MPAVTVHRNCASGMEAITTAALKILAGYGRVFVAGGVESMSGIPLLFPRGIRGLPQPSFTRQEETGAAGHAASVPSRMLPSRGGAAAGPYRPGERPDHGADRGEPGREFAIRREDQDAFALLSNQRAMAAMKEGTLDAEVLPVPVPPRYDAILTADNGPRENQSMEALARLKPYFDRRNGTVTAGNSSQITDGAAALVLMSEKDARTRGLQPLGYLREFAYAGLEPERMGLGPVYATRALLDRAGAAMTDIRYVEINEAFAAQVIACEIAFGSDAFSRQFLARDHKLGELDRDRMNSQGGAIALGHPVGMTGTRLVIHTLRELRRRKENTGLATLCVGGGQGAALLLEVA